MLHFQLYLEIHFKRTRNVVWQHFSELWTGIKKLVEIRIIARHATSYCISRAVSSIISIYEYLRFIVSPWLNNTSLAEWILKVPVCNRAISFIFSLLRSEIFKNLLEFYAKLLFKSQIIYSFITITINPSKLVTPH